MPSDDQFAIIATITMKLASLGHEVTFVEPITEGPLITTFRFAPRAAAKVSQVVSCADDLALALKVEDVVVARLPGESSIGIAVPNKTRTLVNWRDTLATPDAAWPLPLNFGVDAQGKQFRECLTKLPHLLVAGATNGGKSVLIRSMMASLVTWRSPDEVQFVVSDTKKVESGDFIGSPHMLFEPAKTMYETWERMDWIITEVDRRLKILAAAGVRNIGQYNEKDITKALNRRLPYIVLIIDELAHVLGGGEKRGESKIANAKLGRIVSESRAAGVHVLASTQRTSVDVITGSVKANFPSRLTFRLPSETDSRTIIGVGGAEHLLAQGDMLYSSANYPALKRLHSAYASIDDVRAAVEMSKHKSTAR